MEQIKEALDEAIQKAGGVSSFAQAIHAPSDKAVRAWKHIGSIPADYCPTIERVTGVACERLRPNVDWTYLRGTTPKATQSLGPAATAQEAAHSPNTGA